MKIEYTLHPTFKYTDIQKQWIAALASGDYMHGRGRLTVIRDGKDFDCCLGVACKLFKLESRPTTDNEIAMREYFEGSKTVTGVLPPLLINKLGLFSEIGSANYAKALTVLNDRGGDFSEIIDALCLTPELYMRPDDESAIPSSPSPA